MDCLAPPGSLDDFISCHGQGQGTPHQSLQLKGDGVTINKKYLISTKKQQDRGKKMNGLVLVPPKCVNLDQLAIIKKMYEHKLKAISLIIIFLSKSNPNDVMTKG